MQCSPIRNDWLRPFALPMLLALAACGEDGPSNDHGGQVHDAATGHDTDAGAKCDPTLPPLMVGSTQVGRASKLLTATVVSSDPLPLYQGSADWVVDFTTTDGGVPVTDLEFDDVFTTMPVHGHEGSFRPTVSPASEPGRYVFDGFYFNMRGPWEVRIGATSQTLGKDQFVFDVCVEPK